MFGMITYPDEFVSPKEKEKNWFGLEYVRAMYYSNNRFGARLFTADSEFDSLVELSQGRQSVAGLRKLFGQFRNPNNPQSDGPESLTHIDPQVLNLAPKYINRAVAKMQALNYNIAVGAIDIATMDDIKDYEAAVQAFYRIKSWMKDVNLNPQEFFPDIDIDSLPEYPDEYMMDAKVNPKVRKIINAEKTIKLIHQINNTKQALREVCWDIVVIGRGHFEVYLDENFIPRIKRINPKYWIGSYVDNENFQSQENAGYIDFITINQFKKEARAGGLPEKEIEETARHFANVNGPLRSATVNRHPQNFDGLGYVPVVRFYFLCSDERTYRVQDNIHGNPSITEVNNGYQFPEGKEINERNKIIKNEVTSVYGGVWVIDSDVMYGYGRKSYPRTNLVNQTLPIKTFAPNMKEGRVVSFTAQMVEPIFMINVCHNKIKEILAKGWMGIQEIDFNQLEKVSLGRGGKEWTPRQVYEHFLQTNRLVKRGVYSAYDRSNGQAIQEINAGLMLSDYFNTLSRYIQILEAQVGSSVVEQFDQPDRLAVGVMEASVASGNIDMEWLFNAHDEIYEQASHQLLLLAQEAKRHKAKIAGLVPALGKSTLEYYEVPDEMAYTEFGLFITRMASEQQQWQEFYLDVREAVKMGKIGLGDSAFLRNIDNLKEARELFAIREQQFERKVAKANQVNQQAALQANAQAAQLKTQGKMQEQEQQGDIDKELKMLDGQIKERLVKIENSITSQAQQYGDQMKLMIKKQEGQAIMIKQAMANRSADYKTNEQSRVAESIADKKMVDQD